MKNAHLRTQACAGTLFTPRCFSTERRPQLDTSWPLRLSSPFSSLCPTTSVSREQLFKIHKKKMEAQDLHMLMKESPAHLFFFFIPLLLHSISSFLYHFPALHSPLFIFMVPGQPVPLLFSPPFTPSIRPVSSGFPASILCLLRFLPLTCMCAARLASQASFIFANGPAFFFILFIYLCIYVFIFSCVCLCLCGWRYGMGGAFQSHFTLLRVEETRHITLLCGKAERKRRERSRGVVERTQQ